MSSKDERIALAAAEKVADRIFGKPTQPIEVDLDATERELERIAQAHGRSVDDIRRLAEERGLRVVNE